VNDAILEPLEPLLERWAELEPDAIQAHIEYGSRWQVSVLTGGISRLTIGSPQTPAKLRNAIIASAARHGIRLEPTLPLLELLNGLLERLPISSGCRPATPEELETARVNYGGDDVQFYNDALANTADGGVWVQGWVYIPAE